MKFVRIALMASGGFALVAALVAPKTAHALVATLVQVTNTASAPAITSSIDTAGRIPYQSIANVNLACLGEASCTATFPAVPANHRLVVQQASANIQGGGTGAVIYYLGTPNPPNFNAIVTFPGAAGLPFTAPVLAYFDAAQVPALQVVSSSSTFDGFGSVTLTGYLLDCSATSCAAIAQ